MAGGDENPLVDRLNGVHESLPDHLEKSRLFNRTLHLHDPETSKGLSENKVLDSY
jgi:hypothetical protein